MDKKSKDSTGCKDKLSFPTKEKALGMRAAVKYQRGTKLNVYQCSKCDQWHFTSRSQ